MSNRLITRAWGVLDITPAEKLVLLYMSDVAREREPACVCFALNSTIALSCNVSIRFVADTLKKLEAAGHISIASAKRRTAKDTPRVEWRVHPSTPADTSPVTGEDGRSDSGTLAPPHRNFGAAPNKVNPTNPKEEPRPLNSANTIKFDKSLTRTLERLEKLKGPDLLPKALEEKRKLIAERDRLMDLLGIKV